MNRSAHLTLVLAGASFMPLRAQNEIRHLDRVAQHRVPGRPLTGRRQPRTAHRARPTPFPPVSATWPG
jgi:hypothetical protein